MLAACATLCLTLAACSSGASHGSSGHTGSGTAHSSAPASPAQPATGPAAAAAVKAMWQTFFNGAVPIPRRLDLLQDGQQFDLIVATNIFVYYDVFEQALGLMNAASMLRPGRFLLSNNALPQRLVASINPAGSTTVIYTDRPDDSDHLVWYQRR